jgi:hypothetical protein
MSYGSIMGNEILMHVHEGGTGVFTWLGLFDDNFMIPYSPIDLNMLMFCYTFLMTTFRWIMSTTC